MPEMAMKTGLKRLSVVLLLLVTTGWLVGQTRGYYPNNAPGIIARLQYMSGQVSQAPCESSDWVAAEVNQPLKLPVCVWADKDSRAELNVAAGFIRMSSETSITLTTVNRGTVQFGVNQGIASLTVRYLLPGEIVEIGTPNATLTVMKPGVYRVNVDRSKVKFGVNQGIASLTVRYLLPGEIVEIGTPNATLTVMKPGVYRVN